MISNLAKPLIILLFLISNSHASEVSFHGKFVQGGIIIGHSSLAEKVFFDDREIQLSNDGNFIFGFGRNHKKSSIIKLNPLCIFYISFLHFFLNDIFSFKKIFFIF